MTFGLGILRSKDFDQFGDLVYNNFIRYYIRRAIEESRSGAGSPAVRVMPVGRTRSRQCAIAGRYRQGRVGGRASRRYR